MVRSHNKEEVKAIAKKHLKKTHQKDLSDKDAEAKIMPVAA